jgi:hypothetical protein
MNILLSDGFTGTVLGDRPKPPCLTGLLAERKDIFQGGGGHAPFNALPLPT